MAYFCKECLTGNIYICLFFSNKEENVRYAKENDREKRERKVEGEI